MYIGDNSKLFLESTELMRPFKDGEKCTVWANSVHACRTARGVYCAARKVS